MTLELRLRAEAELDLADAALWYEGQCPGLGHQLLDEILTVFSSISKMPLSCQIVHRNTRRALVHRFPFGIYYRVEDDTIVVVAIMHGSNVARMEQCVIREFSAPDIPDYTTFYPGYAHSITQRYS